MVIERRQLCQRDGVELEPTGVFVGGCSGPSDCRANLFCFGVYHGKSWVVTAFEANRLGIFTNGSVALGNDLPFVLWQEIRVEAEAIKCLSWRASPHGDIVDQSLNSPGSGSALFACATEKEILLFKPLSQGPPSWELYLKLPATGCINAVCWSTDGFHLISAGQNLQLWSKVTAKAEEKVEGEEYPKAFKPICVIDCYTNPVTMVQFSADSRFFAAGSEGSCLVKIWFKVEGETGSLYQGLDYIPLAHARSVLALEWRSRSGNSEYVPHMCPQTLATLAKDNCIRIWQETDPNSEVLDILLVHCLTPASPDAHPPAYIGIAWLEFAAAFEGFYYCGVTGKDGLTRESVFLKGPGHLLKDAGHLSLDNPAKLVGGIVSTSRISIDWLVAVDEQSTVSMWGLEGLSSMPRTTLKVNSWYTAFTRFKKTTSRQSSNRYKFHDDFSDLDTTSDSDSAADGKEYQTRAAAKARLCSLVLSDLIAMCSFTVKHDPLKYQTALDPPSTFDVAPEKITVLLWAESLQELCVEFDGRLVDQGCTSTFRNVSWAITPGHATPLRRVHRDVLSQSLMTKSGKTHTVTTVDAGGRAVVRLDTPHKWDVMLLRRHTYLAVATQLSATHYLCASVSNSGELFIQKFSTKGEVTVYQEHVGEHALIDLLVSQRGGGEYEKPFIHVVGIAASAIVHYLVVDGAEGYAVSKKVLHMEHAIHCADLVDCLSLEAIGGEVVCAMSNGQIQVFSEKLEVVAQMSYRTEAEGFLPTQLRNTGCGKIILLSEGSRLKIWEAGVHGVDFHELADIELDRKVASFAYYNIGCRVDILALASTSAHVDIVVQDFSTLIEWRAFIDLTKLDIPASSQGVKVEWISSIEGLMLYVCAGHRTLCYKIPVFTTFPARYKSDAIINAANIFVRSNLGGRLLLSEVPLPVFHPYKLLVGLALGGQWPAKVCQVLNFVRTSLHKHHEEVEAKYGAETSVPAQVKSISLDTFPLKVLEVCKDTAGSLSCLNLSNGFTSAPAEITQSVVPSRKKKYAGAAAALFDEEATTGKESEESINLGKSVNGSSSLSLLSTYRIKGLSSVEQLSLAAVFEIFDEICGEGRSFSLKDADVSAQKFMLGYKVFVVSSRCLPPHARPKGLHTIHCLWALRSEDKQQLVQECLPRLKTTWKNAASLGAGLWVTDTEMCRKVAEEIAQTQFIQSGRNPFEAFLFYVAVGKKQVAAGLFRLAKEAKVAELLANDFSTERWQKAAVKNGFALIRKRRYTHAAGFFLLAGKLEEAVNVIVQYLGDFQLALFLARVYNNQEIARRVVEENIRPFALFIKDRSLFVICELLLNTGDAQRFARVLVDEPLPEVEDSSHASQTILVTMRKSHVLATTKEMLLSEVLYLERLLPVGHEITEKAIIRYVLCHGSRLPLICLQLLEKIETTGLVSDLSASVAGHLLYGLIAKLNLYAVPPNEWLRLKSEVKEFLRSLFSEDKLKRKIRTKAIHSCIQLCHNCGDSLSEAFLYGMLKDEESQARITKSIINYVNYAAERISIHGFEKLEFRGEFSMRLLLCNTVLSQLSRLIGVHVEYMPETSMLAMLYTSTMNKAFSLVRFLLDEECMRYSLPDEALKEVMVLAESLDKKRYQTPSPQGNTFHESLLILVILFTVVDKFGRKFAEQSNLIKLCASQLGHVQKCQPAFEEELHEPSALFSFQDEQINELWRLLKGPNQLAALEQSCRLKESAASIYRIRKGVEIPSRYHFHESKSKVVYRNHGELLLSVALLPEKKNNSKSALERRTMVLARNNRSAFIVDSSTPVPDVEAEERDAPNNRSGALFQSRRSRSKRSPSPAGFVRRSSSGSARFLSRRKGRSASPNLRKKKNVYVNLSSSELYPNYLEKGWTNLYGSIGCRVKDQSGSQFVVPQGISFSSIFNHSESKAVDETTPLCVEAHPFLPLYFTGGAEGTAYLWNSEYTNAVVEFKASEKKNWIKAPVSTIRCAQDGLRLAGSDTAGQLSLWQIHDGGDFDHPIISFVAHSKRTLDTLFLNNSTVVATTGKGQDSFCIWDTLLPPHSRRVAAVNCRFSHSHSFYSLAYLDGSQSVVIGDGHGDLSLFDMRQRTVMFTQKQVHHKAIRTIAVDPSKAYFATGSTDGSIKLWTLRDNFQERAHLLSMHPTHMFVNQATSDSMVSQRGTTGLVFTEDYLYSCGADGTVKETPKYVLDS